MHAKIHVAKQAHLKVEEEKSGKSQKNTMHTKDETNQEISYSPFFLCSPLFFFSLFFSFYPYFSLPLIDHGEPRDLCCVRVTRCAIYKYGPVPVVVLCTELWP